MKIDKIRLYINITNNCNANCEFCCMWSDSSKHTFMDFDTFKKIIDEKKEKFELQLEGGEPLLHKDMYLFMEYAKSTGRCVKIIILTNGILLDKHLKRLVEFHKNYQIPILIKISANYWLYKMDPLSLDKLKDYYLATKYIDGIEIKLNVRLRHEDEWLRDLIDEKGLTEISNIFYLQSYGKYEEKTEYDKPVIVQNIDDWFIYACDCTCFNKDLIARSNYEKELS